MPYIFYFYVSRIEQIEKILRYIDIIKQDQELTTFQVEELRYAEFDRPMHFNGKMSWYKFHYDEEKSQIRFWEI